MGGEKNVSSMLHPAFEVTVIPTQACVMFWSSVSYYGVGTLVPIEGNINSQKYVEVLESNLWLVILIHCSTHMPPFQ